MEFKRMNVEVSDDNNNHVGTIRIEDMLTLFCPKNDGIMPLYFTADQLQKIVDEMKSMEKSINQ